MAARRWFVGAALVALIVSYGCGEGPCRGSETRMVPLSEFPCAEMNADGWASHPFPPVTEECRWFNFQGCSEYTFENPIGRAPIDINGYLAFEPDGGFSTLGSGNSFIIDAATDTEIVIRNAQNADFFLRLTVR